MAEAGTKTIKTLSPDDFDIDNKVELGVGSFAKVYAVGSKMSPRARVAIKYPRMEDIHSSTDNDELSIMSRIDHENIIQFYGVIYYKERTCFVMECALHGTLHDVVIAGKRPSVEAGPSTRLRWMQDIAQGLVYLHHTQSPPVSHGDIKSKNILICAKPDGETVAKLADFGVARELSMTTSDTGGSSFLWAAPEIRMRVCKSPKSDVWSFGATVIELFTSRQPYDHVAVPPKNLGWHILNENLTPLSGLPEETMSSFPTIVRLILDNTFQTDHVKRWSMQEILKALTRDRPSDKLMFCIWCPRGRGQARVIDTAGDRFLACLLERAAAIFERVPLLQPALFFTEEGRWRPEEAAEDEEEARAVLCWDEEANLYKRVDPDSGVPREEKHWLTVRRRYLSDTSVLPWSSVHLPVLRAFTRIELWQADAPDFGPVHQHALFDLRFLVLLQGVRVGDRKLFWRLHGDQKWCDADSGELFLREGNLPGDEDRQRVFLLLKKDDPVPRIRVPEDRYLMLQCRPNADVVVQEGHLCQRTVTPTTSPEEWESTRFFPSELDINFSAACRERSLGEGLDDP